LVLVALEQQQVLLVRRVQVLYLAQSLPLEVVVENQEAVAHLKMLTAAQVVVDTGTVTFQVTHQAELEILHRSHPPKETMVELALSRPHLAVVEVVEVLVPRVLPVLLDLPETAVLVVLVLPQQLLGHP